MLATESPKRYRILNGMARKYETVLPYVRPGDRVLDLCAGSGFGSQILANSGLRVVALDRYPDCLPYRTGIEIVKANVLETVPDMGVFDAVTWIDAIEHFRLPDQNIILDRIRGWLKPEGVLIVDTPISDTGGLKNQRHVHEHTWQSFGEIVGSKFSILRRYRIDFVGDCITVMTESSNGFADGFSDQVIVSK